MAEERFLPVQKQQKKVWGKCGFAAEWGRRPGDKGEGKGQGTECLYLPLLPVNSAFRRPRVLSEGQEQDRLTLGREGSG